jgi:hypothetical protein
MGTIEQMAVTAIAQTHTIATISSQPISAVHLPHTYKRLRRHLASESIITRPIGLGRLSTSNHRAKT